MQQESVTAQMESEDSHHHKKSSGQQQQPLGMMPPQELIAFPPLAYLLNIFLIGLNHLKDCPLISLQPLLTHRLREIMTDLCSFILSHSNDIRERGKKYLISISSSAPSHHHPPTAVMEMTMDQLYAKHMQSVIDYCLLCFQLIYSGETFPPHLTPSISSPSSVF
jgi:hypothetical protein